MNDDVQWVHIFDCESIPLEPGTPAGPRPPGRERELSDHPFPEPQFVSFECETVPLEPDTPAAPRPPDRPRLLEPSAELMVRLRSADGTPADELLARVRDALRQQGLAIEVLPADPDRRAG